jgi:hypothetical protein
MAGAGTKVLDGVVVIGGRLDVVFVVVGAPRVVFPASASRVV